MTTDVAHEICLREGIKAMLTGSISSLGNHYVITLAALNAQTGDFWPASRSRRTAKNKC